MQRHLRPIKSRHLQALTHLPAHSFAHTQRRRHEKRAQRTSCFSTRELLSQHTAIYRLCSTHSNTFPHSLFKRCPSPLSCLQSNRHCVRSPAPCRYYKQARNGPCTRPKPHRWEVIKRHKWEAWTSLGGMPREEAMKSCVPRSTRFIPRVTAWGGDRCGRDWLAWSMNLSLQRSF